MVSGKTKRSTRIKHGDIVVLNQHETATEALKNTHHSPRLSSDICARDLEVGDYCGRLAGLKEE